MQDQMKLAIEYVNAAPKIKMGRGKGYTQVAQRVEALRLHFPHLSLTTEIVKDDGEVIVMKATLSDVKPGVYGYALATGYAEEVRSSKGVNSTSALENCETSSIGRCLAAFGLHGGEYASAGEVEHAIAQQEAPKASTMTLDAITQLFKDADKMDEREEYRKQLRIAAWADLTEERAKRVLERLEAKFAREYAEGAAADAKGDQ